MATGHQKQYVVAGIALVVLGIACANPLPQREVVSNATAMPTVPEYATPYPTPCLAVVTAEHLNLRNCPGTYCGVVKEQPQLKQGDRVLVTKYQAEWVQVWTGEELGWVHEDYIKECE